MEKKDKKDEKDEKTHEKSWKWTIFILNSIFINSFISLLKITINNKQSSFAFKSKNYLSAVSLRSPKALYIL